MSAPNIKKNKNDSNRDVSDTDLTKEAKSMIEKFLGDVSKTSATKQIIIGTTSGWCVYFSFQFFSPGKINFLVFFQ